MLYCPSCGSSYVSACARAVHTTWRCDHDTDCKDVRWLRLISSINKVCKNIVKEPSHRLLAQQDHRNASLKGKNKSVADSVGLSRNLIVHPQPLLQTLQQAHFLIAERDVRGQLDLVRHDVHLLDARDELDVVGQLPSESAFAV